jgi:lysophospholipase L1-like esterase
VVVLVVAAGVAIALWPVSTTALGWQSASTPAPATPVEPVAVPLTFAVVGDSISARTDRTGKVDQTTGSWTSYATGDDLEFVGTGWAQNGATLAEMKSKVAPVGTDVLVILAGTNDLTSGVPLTERLAIVGQIAERSGASRIVVSAVPPYNSQPVASTEWNTALADYAAAKHWQFVDPWSTLRTADGSYIAGYTFDGVHPTVDAAEVVGAAIRTALVQKIGIEA